MADYRTDAEGDRVVVEHRSGAGRILAIVALLAVVIIALLFMTGFWSANVTKEGSLPTVDVSAKGGSLPKVDLDSKKVVVGTEQATVDVPKVETEKKSIAVPVVGVTDGSKDK